MKKVLLLVLLFAAVAIDAQSQCAMCGAVAESAQKNGSEMAEGLNAGILYLMGVPYLLLMGFGFLMFRRIRKQASNQ